MSLMRLSRRIALASSRQATNSVLVGESMNKEAPARMVLWCTMVNAVSNKMGDPQRVACLASIAAKGALRSPERKWRRARSSRNWP